MTSDRERFERTVDFLRQRKGAYCKAFASEAEVETMSEAYDRVFLGSTAGQMVLRDLAKFCRAMETLYDPDPRKTDILIGRNEIWKRIQEHLNLTPSELFDIYGDRTVKQRIQQEDEEE